MALRLGGQPLAPALLAALLAALALLGPLAPARSAILAALLVLAGLASALYIGWRVHPAYTLSAAVALSVMAGNWSLVGVPGPLAPDRLLFVGAIVAVLFRAPSVRDRPPLRFGAVHWVMVIALAWVIGSAIASQTITDRGQLFEIIERFGIIPFFLFLVAPVVFARERERDVLMVTLVALGGYLGLTALSEAMNGPAFPTIINDASVGIHPDRARGPFLEAVTNGAGMFACMVGCGVALTRWKERNWRLVAGGVMLLCSVGLLFTETRSVWLGGVVTITAVVLGAREFRRFALPVGITALVMISVSLALIPGLADAVNERQNQQATVWDRQNLSRAATGMVEQNPLLGVGWGEFVPAGREYFRQSPDYPLTAWGQPIHNVFLTYAAEIGLVGLALWLLALLLGVIRAVKPSPNPGARAWKVGFVAYLIFFMVVSNFVFPQVFPNDLVWLLAGVAIGAGEGTSEFVSGGAQEPRVAAGGI